jgi:hypothetical protein
MLSQTLDIVADEKKQLEDQIQIREEQYNNDLAIINEGHKNKNMQMIEFLVRTF